MWFQNRFNTNCPVQPQKKARSLKEEELYFLVKTETLITFALSAKLVCTFVFAYADCWFSDEAAHIVIQEQTSTFYRDLSSLHCFVDSHNIPHSI